MKKSVAFFGICCVFAVLLAACDRQQAPIKQGLIWKVVWSPQQNQETGLYREPMPAHPNGGQYGVDVYGLLYPNFLEIRWPANDDSHSQIIPLSQIISLEFGTNGV